MRSGEYASFTNIARNPYSPRPTSSPSQSDKSSEENNLFPRQSLKYLSAFRSSDSRLIAPKTREAYRLRTRSRSSALKALSVFVQLKKS